MEDLASGSAGPPLIASPPGEQRFDSARRGGHRSFPDRLGEVWRRIANNPTRLVNLAWVSTEVGAQSPREAVVWGNVEIGGVSRESLTTRAPSSVTYQLTLPARPRFDSWVGIASHETAKTPAAGVPVELKVEVVESARSTGEGNRQALPPASKSFLLRPGNELWVRFVLDLSGWDGRHVDMTLSAGFPGDSRDPAPGGAVAWADPWVAAARGPLDVLSELRRQLFDGGLLKALGRALRIVGLSRDQNYVNWSTAQQPSSIRLHLQRREVARWPNAPVISIVGVDRRPEDADAAWANLYRSLRRQSYPRWELCLISPSALLAFTRLAGRDPRVKWRECDPAARETAGAYNQALALSSGDFVALVDPDISLSRDALYAMAREVLAHPDTDVLYSDEGTLGADGRPAEPVFKPDWSPEHFLCRMYTGQLTLFRRSTVLEAGGLRPEMAGAVDYDLALRVCTRARRIGHVRRILCQRPSAAGPASSSDLHAIFEVSAERGMAAIRVVEDHLARQGIAAACEQGLAGSLGSARRIRYAIQGSPLVSVVIITAGQTRNLEGREIDLLANLVDSIVRLTQYPHYEVLCVHNGDLRSSTRAELDRLNAEIEAARSNRGAAGDGPAIRLVTFDRPFNVSDKYNRGAEQARGEHLLFMNDDMQVLTGEWMSAMLEYSQQSAVGAVGAKLFFPSGAIQHAGVFVHSGAAGHVYYARPASYPGRGGDAYTPRNYSAVTGACLMTRQTVYREVGGFNLVFPVNFNDIDYCLKLRQRGYRTIYTPYAQLRHFESLSRTGGIDPAELRRLRDIWGDKILTDPYFNALFYQ